MDLLSKIRGLSYIGWSNLVAALRYTIRLGALERRAGRNKPRPAPSSEPGPLISLTPESSGLRCHYAESELEIRFLAPDFVRITWQPGSLPIPYAIQRTEWADVPVKTTETPDGWRLDTAEITLQLGTDGSLRWIRPEGSLLRHDLPPKHTGGRWLARFEANPDDHYFGLGERTAPLDLKGGRFRMWNREPKGQYGPGDDPLYIGIPVYLAIHPGGSHLTFFENPFDATISFSDEVHASFEGGALRYYLAVGPPARLLECYGELTGRPPLPPRWALGFHQSRWSYRDEGEVRDLVQGFSDHRLPLSAVHLDIHYMDGYRVFTVDGQRFPDLPGLTAELAAKGIHTVVILDPGVKRDPAYDLYQDGIARGTFCKLPGGEPVVAPVWPGNCLFPDFTDPEVRDWWGEQYEFLLEQGAHGFWHDMNEPAAFTAWGATTLPTVTRHDLEKRGGDHLEAHNLYGQLECQSAFQALQRLRPDRRPWLLTRSGWAGLQRYAWTWTGDCETNWWSLAQSLRIALSMGLSGVPYSGPDIGGFSGNPDEELFVRWFQLAALLPFFRVHSAGFTAHREPWCHSTATQAILREFLSLRYRLLPYLYTLAYQASQTGHPLVRPLFWEQPESPQHWTIDDTFLLGPSLLVAPVLQPGCQRRQVLFPNGDWYSFWNDRLLSGPGPHQVDTPLERIGLFVRSGAVLPTEKADRLVLHLYAPLPEGNESSNHAQEGVPVGATGEPSAQESGSLYRDAGDGYGPFRLDRFQLMRQGDTLLLERSSRGEFDPDHSNAQVVLHGAELKSAVVDGAPAEVRENRLVVGDFRQVRLELTPHS
ncbi:MAG: hypothetical protein JW797_14845 [Bradymonadales bacterium]|nr:hypothetical protein [Bradymonadales bacterium]